MPKIHEVFGRDVEDRTQEATAHKKAAYCQFIEGPCDGGGNRHQTKIKLLDSELRPFFNDDLKSVVPGICSIEYGREAWIVCPRRLLGFSASDETVPSVNANLQDHERLALLAAGLPANVELGVWSEVYLQYEVDDTSINYHLDFVIAPVQRRKSFNWLLDKYQIRNPEEIELVKKYAKIGKYISGRYDPEQILDVLPDLESPTIIEVMTASTSGSDTEAGTNIAASFADAIMGRDHNCPGINKRQVWGRMATQLFAKSALAEAWGGKTVWLVQDQLLRNIELTTKLNLNISDNSKTGTINFLSMAYRGESKGKDSLKVDRYVQKKAGLAFTGSDKAVDILLPKVYPDKSQLLKSVLRRKLAGIIKL